METVSLFPSLSLSLTLSLSLSLCVYLSLSLTLCQCLSLSLCLSLPHSLYVSISVCLSLLLCVYVSLSLCPIHICDHSPSVFLSADSGSVMSSHPTADTFLCFQPFIPSLFCRVCVCVCVLDILTHDGAERPRKLTEWFWLISVDGPVWTDS